MKLSELLADRDRLVNRLPVPVLMSTEAAERLGRAQEKVDEAKVRVKAAEATEAERMAKPFTEQAKTELGTAEAELEEARAEAVPHLVDFVVESLGSDEWEELANAHPPTDEQRERLKDPRTNRPPEFDPSTFPLAAVAFCLKDPEPDPSELAEYAAAMRAGFPAGIPDIPSVRGLKRQVPDIVWQQLFGAVLKVNRGANRVDPSWLGFGTTTGSEPASEPQSS